MSSPNAQRRGAAMSRSTLQHGEFSSSSALNPTFPVYQTEVYNMAGRSDSPYYSPPPTFMPPESPNTPSYPAHDTPVSLAARPIQIYTRPSQGHTYSGVTLAPGQRGSLTAYGQFTSSIPSSDAALRGVPGQEQPMHLLPPGMNHPLERPSRQRTSGAEASQLDAPQGGRLLQANPQSNRSRISFSDLASQKGVRKWSDEIFDDRWVLRSDEMWNVDPRRRSVITVSPSPKSSLWCTDDQVRAQAQATQSQSRRVQDMFVGTILDRRAHLHHRKVTGKDGSQSHRAVAARVGLNAPQVRKRTLEPILYGDHASLREVKKLARIFREHVDDRFLLPSALPFSQRAIREYLRERIFGPEDARYLIRSQREQLILYGSNPITRDALRKYLFVVVDGMAEDMTSPHRDVTRDPEDPRHLGQDSPVNTSPTDSSLSGDFDIIHHHLTIRKEQKPDKLPDDRQLDRPTGQGLPLRAPQRIPDERQMDRQMSQKMASSALPSAPDQRQLFANARPPIPYERQMVSLAPQLMPYPGHGMNHYSQPPSYPAFNPYNQYLADPQYEQRHRQNFFGTPDGFPGPYHQMNHFAPQLYAAVHLHQPPPVYPFYGRHQHDSFIQSVHVPPPVMRPAAPQRLAPKVLRAGLLGFDSNTMSLSGHASTVAGPETAQPVQQSTYSVPSASARILQPPKDSATTGSAQRLQTSAYIAPSSSAQSHPSSTFLASSSARILQPLRHSSGHETAQPAQPLRPSLGLGPFHNVMPALRPLPYQAGLDITKPQGTGVSSVKLKDLTRHGKPSFAIATNEGIVPFVQSAKESNPAQWGVVKVSNIPYSLTRGEVVAFFGRNAKLVSPDFGSPIHIIMDRSTGKTNDCYVEFFSTGDAQAAVNRLYFRGHQLKIGTAPNDRVVAVEVSSQDVLLKELFPRAKNVLWKDGKPNVEVTDEPFNTGFKSFITGEEMVMLVRHAEQPHRSSYTQKCPQRTYETMISTLVKFPWRAVEYYTVATRNQIFIATRDQIKTLVANLKRGGAPNITQSLLTELMFAGLNAFGFSEKQRWELVQAAEYVGGEVKLSPLMKWWPWETLGRKFGSNEDVIEYYASLFKSHPATVHDGDNPFGTLVSTASVDLNNITMEEMARVEWDQFKTLLRDVLA